MTLPVCLVEPLRAHLGNVCAKHEADLRACVGRVESIRTIQELLGQLGEHGVALFFEGGDYGEIDRGCADGEGRGAWGVRARDQQW